MSQRWVDKHCRQAEKTVVSKDATNTGNASSLPVDVKAVFAMPIVVLINGSGTRVTSLHMSRPLIDVATFVTRKNDSQCCAPLTSYRSVSNISENL